MCRPTPEMHVPRHARGPNHSHQFFISHAMCDIQVHTNLSGKPVSLVQVSPLLGDRSRFLWVQLGFVVGWGIAKLELGLVSLVMVTHMCNWTHSRLCHVEGHFCRLSSRRFPSHEVLFGHFPFRVHLIPSILSNRFAPLKV